jgi:hypothetical protein
MDFTDKLMKELVKGRKDVDPNGITAATDTLRGLLEFIFNNVPLEDQCNYIYKVFSGVMEDEIAIPIDLLKDILELQYEFYLRCDNKDNIRLEGYKQYSLNPEDYYNTFIAKYDDEHASITFRFNPFASIQQNINKFEVFSKRAKQYIKLITNEIYDSNYKEIECSSALMVFCKEIGDNQKSWSNKINTWKRCLKVFDWHYRDKIKNAEIARKLDIYKKNDKNCFKDVRELLAEANRLVKSAEQGSFPL